MKIIATLKHGYQWGALNAEKFLEPLALFFMRFTVAKVFLDSGLLKWDGFLKFNIDTYDLFLYEFFCPEDVRPGALLLCDPNTLDYAEGSLAVPFIELLALGAGFGEVILPVLLILGLFGRFAALGLLGMTLFIQFAVFPSWSHWVNPAVWWAATLLVLVARGPGFLSLDRLIKLEKA
jgi:putative oxidoreductase